MRKQLTAMVAGMGVLAGCQGKLAGSVQVGPSAAPSAKPGPAARPSGAPGAVQPAAKLQAPAGATKLAGQVLFEARYAVQVAGATPLVGNDGASLLGVGGALIGNDGSTLIGNDGSTMVAAGGGNVIVPASLIGNDGSTLIGNDGSTLIGNDGSTYKLAQAGAAALPAYGDRWRAAGAWVQVVDLRTGRVAPVGVDAAGKPVYAVYSNLQGGFELYLDPALAPHARLVVRESGRPDPRMVLTVLPSLIGPAGEVEDDGAAVTSYMRYIFARKLLAVLGIGLARDRAASELTADAVAEVALSEQLGVAKAAIKEAGIDKLDEARRLEIGLLLADAVLTRMDFKSLKLAADGATLRDPASQALIGQPIFEAMKRGMTSFRAAAVATVKDQGDPAAYFAGRPWLVALNRRLPEDQRYRLDRAADVAEVLTKEFFSEVTGSELQLAFDVLRELGVGLQARDMLSMASNTTLRAFFGLFVDPEAFGGQDAGAYFADLLRQGGAAIARQAPRPAAARRPALPLPPVPARVAATVATLAGRQGVPGFADGPGEAATFGLMHDIVVDPNASPPVLYVADGGTRRIRRIALDAQGRATVTTVAGAVTPAGTALAAIDGPGEVARFVDPVGLALDAQGRLYVADRGADAIRRLTFDAAGQATVETLAGRDTPAGGDLPLNDPADVLVEPSGDVLIADMANQALRRLRLGGGTPTLAWLAGSKTQASREQARRIEGPLAEAWLALPASLARGADGTIFFSELGSHALRAVRGLGGASPFTELLAGGGPSDAPLEGSWGLVRLAMPSGVAVDPQGRVVVTDSWQHRVRLVWPDGHAQVLAGGGEIGEVATDTSYSGGGHADGDGAAARFAHPMGVAVGPDGTIYVVDQRNFQIRTITLK